MTALPKASGMVEDHPLCRKTLIQGRFLWTSVAGKSTVHNSLLAQRQCEAKGNVQKKADVQ